MQKGYVDIEVDGTKKELVSQEPIWKKMLVS